MITRAQFAISIGMMYLIYIIKEEMINDFSSFKEIQGQQM
jgi:hypothetical protein